MNQDLYDYIDSHVSAAPEYLAEIERDSHLNLLNGRMCSGNLQGRLLKMLTAMMRPKRVLELGTFSGYSALCIAEGLEDGATIDTVEIDDELEDIIRANLSKTHLGERVTLHIGSGEEVMKQWGEETFDMIFLDADKRRYCEDYALALPLLKKGGVILADNTLWGGHVIDEGDKSNQTRGIKEFNEMIINDPRVETLILPLRDGLTLIRKL